MVLALPIEDSFRDDVREDPWLGPVIGIAPAVYDVLRGFWDGPGFFEMIEENVGTDPREATDRMQDAVREAAEGLEKDDGSND